MGIQERKKREKEMRREQITASAKLEIFVKGLKSRKIMGTQERRKREKEMRRKQITAAAKRVFFVKGLNKTTMKDIAEEAELSPGTIYLYFKNKEELYASLSLKPLMYLDVRLSDIASNDKGLVYEQRLAAFKEAMYDVYRFEPLLLSNILYLQSNDTLKNPSPAILCQIKDLYDRLFGKITEIFDEEIKNSHFISGSSKDLSNIIWALFLGLVFWEDSKRIIYNHNENNDQLKLTLETAFGLFSQGLNDNMR